MDGLFTLIVLHATIFTAMVRKIIVMHTIGLFVETVRHVFSPIDINLNQISFFGCMFHAWC